MSAEVSRRLTRRRNPIHPTSRRLSYTFAALAGFGMCFVGLSPTGSIPVDALLVFSATAACVWAAATAPWWVLTACAGVVAAFSRDLVAFLPAAAAGITMAAVGARTLNAAWLRSLCAVAIVFAASRLRVPGPFGLESLVGLTTCAALFAAGVNRRPRVVRRRAVVGVAAVATAAVVATGMFVASAFSSRVLLTNGNEQAQRGLDALSVGEVDAAEAAFTAAARSFGRADGQLDRVFTQPARLVPFVAQHRNSSSTLAGGAAKASERLAATLSELDVDSVRVVNGRIDLAAVEALEPRLLELQDTVEVLADVVERAENPWLVDALQRQLRDTAADVEKRREQGETALAAVRGAPAILGADGPKVYFVAFATPVEARGSVGFMGNYAELTVDAGEITMTDFGRHTDLREAAGEDRLRLDDMDDFLVRYGRFGFARPPEGYTARDVWQLVTIPPHFPSTAQVIAELYPQSGGTQIDGVVTLDPTTLAALLEFTGPVEVDGIDEPLDAANAEQYLLFDQYLDFEDDNPDRIDTLETLSTEAVELLLAGALPGPTELGRVMGPLAADGHLVVWMADLEAQELVETLAIDGGLPDRAGGDGIAIGFNNVAGNKIDAFLETHVVYDRDIDPDTGELRGTLTLEMINNAPASGLPRYVIGNVRGMPLGTNRTHLSLYAPFLVESSTLDGEPFELTTELEQGWFVMGEVIELRPGGSATLQMTFTGFLDRFGPDIEPVVMLPNLPIRPTLEITDS